MTVAVFALLGAFLGGVVSGLASYLAASRLALRQELNQSRVAALLLLASMTAMKDDLLWLSSRFWTSLDDSWAALSADWEQHRAALAAGHSGLALGTWETLYSAIQEAKRAHKMLPARGSSRQQSVTDLEAEVCLNAEKALVKALAVLRDLAAVDPSYLWLSWRAEPPHATDVDG
jgi:hypothetical protein